MYCVEVEREERKSQKVKIHFSILARLGMKCCDWSKR